MLDETWTLPQREYSLRRAVRFLGSQNVAVVCDWKTEWVLLGFNRRTKAGSSPPVKHQSRGLVKYYNDWRSALQRTLAF